MAKKKFNTQIAVLMTSHCRRKKTLACLYTLSAQALPPGTLLVAYLVDDGSTDGTGEAVRERYPFVKVISGDGSLYWCGGMRRAWREALRGNYDYYLWLNDDTLLYKNAINVLLESASVVKRNGYCAAITGTVCDPQRGTRTYGGVRTINKFGMISFIPVDPCSDRPVQCSTFNGNVVLIPRKVQEKVGNISSAFTHGIGDYDYGLRALEKGFTCWVAPSFVGTCKKDPIEGSYRDRNVPVRERLLKMNGPTGLPPAKEWMIFTKRHAGWLWPVCWLRTMVRVVFPRLWLWLRT